MSTFAQVAMARSFNRAAVEMDISAAVITRRIQELESALGVKLISRNSRPLSLTQAGDHYLAFCIKILNAMAAEEAALHSLQNDASGKLTVVVPVSLGVMVLAKANAQFATLYPDISISLIIADHWKDGFDPLDYQADVLIRATRPKDSSLQMRKLGVFSWLTCASPTYLAEHGRPATPQDLTRHACLIPNRPFGSSQIRFKHDGVSTRVHLRGHVAPNSAVAMLYMAKESHGVAILPHFCAHDDLRAGTLERVLPEYSILDQVVWAYHGYETRPPRKVGLFLDFLVKWMKTSAPELGAR